MGALSRRRIGFIALYGVAMGFLEAAVVIYLRRLYYPNGFDFPLVLLPADIVLVELGREVATILMLWAVADLSGRNGLERFAWFSILFGVWDIVYYVALKLILDWPASLFTWDILFLVPLIWTGPVLAPILVSLGLIGGGFRMLDRAARGVASQLEWVDRIGLLLSVGLLLAAFVANHGRVVRGGMPGRFPWVVFVAGCFVAAVVAVRIERGGRQTSSTG